MGKSAWAAKIAAMTGGRASGIARGVFVLASCLAGIALYASVVGKKYPVADWLTWRLGLVWSWVLLFEVGCVGIGFLVLWRLLRLRTLPLLESLLMSKAIGLGIFGFTFYAAGALRLFRPWFAVALAVAFAAAGAFDLVRRLRMEQRTWRHRAPGTPLATWFGLAATCFGAACFLLLWLQTLTPESINFDATWYHVPIAQDYARAGQLIPFYGDYNRAFAHLTSMVFTWGFLVPGLSAPLKWICCLQLEMAVVVWKAVGVAVAARWMLGGQRVRGLWAVFFLFPGIFVYDQNPGASADHFLGFFALPVLIAAGRALPRLDLRWCAVLGIALGGAVLVKTQAIYLVGFAGVLLGVRWAHLAGRALLRRLRPRAEGPRPDAPPLFVPTWRHLILVAVVVGGMALLIAAPHFVKNAVFYKNPLYPFAQNLFPSFPEHEKSALLFAKLYPNTPHLPKGEGIMRHVTAVGLFFRFSFDPHYSFTKGFPVMGSLFTLFLPMALVVRRPGRVWIGIAAAFVSIVLWAETYTGDRYLQGVITIPAAVTAALMVRGWDLGWLARAGLVPLVAFQLVYGADAPFYSGSKRIVAAIDLARSGFEGKRKDEQRFKSRSEHRKIDAALPEDAVLLVRNYRTTLGIARPVIFDIQAWQAHIFYEPLKTPAELWEHLRARGITHLLYPENQRPPDTLQAAVLFDALARSGEKRKKYGSLTVVDMPTTPPPGEAPFRVVVQGMPKYTDGLYRVEQLNAYDRDKKNVIFQKPTPEEKLAKDKKNAAELLDKASAVVLGKKKKKTLEGLGDRFVEVERFKEYTVHLLKTGETAPTEDDGGRTPTPTDDPPDPDEIDDPDAPADKGGDAGDDAGED